MTLVMHHHHDDIRGAQGDMSVGVGAGRRARRSWGMQKWMVSKRRLRARPLISSFFGLQASRKEGNVGGNIVVLPSSGWAASLD